MSEPGLRIDPLTGSYVAITPWRQRRPELPDGPCPFCPGGTETPDRYEVAWIPNRWPGLPGGRHEVILHSPRHHACFRCLGPAGVARVVELWSQRTAALGARRDVAYVFIAQNRGRATGATIDHPHSQIFAFGVIPPIPRAELAAARCALCQAPDQALVVSERAGWRASVPWAPSWPYEMLMSTCRHEADLPSAGPRLRAGLGLILVDALARLEQILGPAAPYMLWLHQRPAGGRHWPAAHLHAHLAPLLRKPGAIRHLAAAELGAGVFFDPVEPTDAAARLKDAGTQPFDQSCRGRAWANVHRCPSRSSAV